MTRAPTRSLIALTVLAVLGTACGGKGDPADQPPPAPLDLAGSRVMMIPARSGEPRELEPELMFWLAERSPTTDWVSPAAIREAVASIPAGFALDAPRRLVEGSSGEPRLADPLYGDIRRLGAVLDVQLALVPMGTRVRPDSAGLVVELTAVMASIHGGRVLWMHTVRSAPVGSVSQGVADAAETLARTLVRADG